MNSAPSHTDFARFEDRVDETLEKQMGRVESKLDELGRAVRSLAVLEERQATYARQVDELRASTATMSERFENRATAMGERFDARVSDLANAHREVEARLNAYVQRYVGVSMALGVLWAVGSHFLKG